MPTATPPRGIANLGSWHFAWRECRPPAVADGALRGRFEPGGAGSRPAQGAIRTSRGGVSADETPASRLRTAPLEWEGSQCHDPLADPAPPRRRPAHRAHLAPRAPPLTHREPIAVTLLATPARRRPASHAFTVPVVRELAPQSALVGSGW